MAAHLDLFARLRPNCGACAHLGAAIDSGVRYCGCLMMWRWAAEQPDCAKFEAAARG